MTKRSAAEDERPAEDTIGATGAIEVEGGRIRGTRLACCSLPTSVQNIPSWSFAASDMRSRVHGGSHTTSTLTSATPAPRRPLPYLLRQELRRRTGRRRQRHADADDARTRRRSMS